MATKTRKPAKPYMPKVGDRVRIRTRESMIREFGADAGGDPDVRSAWRSYMDGLCGRTATVKGISKEGASVDLTSWSSTEDNVNCNYSTDVLEPAKESAAHKRARLEREHLAEIVRRKKAAAERRAAAAAEKKALKARDKARARLPAAAKRALLYLDENTYAFGCQREHVLGIVAALTGVNVYRLKEAAAK